MSQKSPITKQAEEKVENLQISANELQRLADNWNNETNPTIVKDAIKYYKEHLMAEAERIQHSLECGSEDGNLLSHSESHILQECISLMDDVYRHFEQWVEWSGIALSEEEKEATQLDISYYHIVKRLFLWNTSHSGGTSTYAKCRELNVNEDEVHFAFREEDE